MSSKHKSKKKRKAPQPPTLAAMPFEQLVADATELADYRRTYAQKSAKDRRGAAEYAYDAGYANQLFSQCTRHADAELIYV